jgi:hypothetical protein
LSKYHSEQTGRPYAEVRGYLRQPLELPAVDAVTGLLTPSSAIVAAYATDSAGVWRYVGEAKVWAYDESLSALVKYYCRASLTADDRFEVFWVGCSSTLITLPTIRQAAAIDRVDLTAAPPSEVLGDRYILDDGTGTVHADWDGATLDDIVQFDGSVWVAANQVHGWIVYLSTPAQDWQYSGEQPAGWTEVV